MPKKKFIHTQIWLLSISGAFQRANIYNNEANEKGKIEMKFKLKAFIDNVLLQDYKKGNVSDAIHLENIKQLSEFSNNFAAILKDGKLRFGVSQKLLNLYLKFLWCIQEIEVPPHFPVDSIIQKELNYKPSFAWTKLEGKEGVEKYMQLIEFARDNFSNYRNIATLELELFNEK